MFKPNLFKWKKANWETGNRVSMLCEDVEDLLNRVSELEEKVGILNKSSSNHENGLEKLIASVTQYEKSINALCDQVELLQTKVKFEKEKENE